MTMSLDIWSRDDIRNIILAANAASADAAMQARNADDSSTAQQVLSAYRDGYEAALIAVATAFGIPLADGRRLRAPGVVIPASRLSVSYRAEQALNRLLAAHEEWTT